MVRFAEDNYEPWAQVEQAPLLEEAVSSWAISCHEVGAHPLQYPLAECPLPSIT